MVGTGNGSPTLPSSARQACQGSGGSGTVHIGRFSRLGARSSHGARSHVLKKATVSFLGSDLHRPFGSAVFAIVTPSDARSRASQGFHIGPVRRLIQILLQSREPQKIAEPK